MGAVTLMLDVYSRQRIEGNRPASQQCTAPFVLRLLDLWPDKLGPKLGDSQLQNHPVCWAARRIDRRRAATSASPFGVFEAAGCGSAGGLLKGAPSGVSMMRSVVSASSLDSAADTQNPWRCRGSMIACMRNVSQGCCGTWNRRAAHGCPCWFGGTSHRTPACCCT